jgi:poly-gamma-glutamate biosynthesis protein PgsC/CapC
MSELLAVAIGIGLAVSLLFSELFGLAAGGMVVPGYVALKLNDPIDVLITIAAAVATYLIVHLTSTVVIVYGKRRTVLMILVGYLIGMAIGNVDRIGFLPTEGGVFEHAEFQAIGYIIPGLIAIWIDRQGLIETISTLLTAGVAVRLALILIFGDMIRL